MGAMPEVRKAIVGGVSVIVIDVARRVLAMDLEPGETMLIMPHPVDPDRTISAMARPRFASGGRPPGSRHPPSEAAGPRKISEYFLQSLLGQGQGLFATLLRHACLHAGFPSVAAARSRRAADSVS